MDINGFRYEDFKEGFEKTVSEMIWEVFEEFEAPEYGETGIRIFKEFIDPLRLVNEVRKNTLRLICCFEGETLVGVLALRNLSHISLLFVKKSHHRKGIAKGLLNQALEHIAALSPCKNELTVNSSPYAVDIYKRMGFFPIDEMQEKDGIIYLPMKRILSSTEIGELRRQQNI